jgi:hypothetical protein
MSNKIFKEKNMKKLLVCFIALAMSIGFALTPAIAANSPWEPGDNTDPHGQLPFPHMYVDPGGIGDLLLFSLYDVRPVDGRGALWENYIAIENTSGKWTAFHLRFRAWKKSIEVFDHVILLSPYDVFWMTLGRATGTGDTTYPCLNGAGQVTPSAECPNGFEQYEAGDVVMYSGDTHTLANSALIYTGAPLSQTIWRDKFQDSLLVFNGFDSENGRAPKAELQAGYIEAIGLWSLSVPGDKSEDTHDLAKVVSDIFPDPAVPGTINVYDALDALFYRFFTSEGIKEATRTTTVPEQEGQPARYACDVDNTYTGCWSKYPVSKTAGIDSAWPDFVPLNIPTTPASKDLLRPVKIERTVQPAYNSALEYVAEAPAGSATRYGEDCGNVLAGNMIMGDADNGKYQMENFIAVRNFRSDSGPSDGDLPTWTHIYYTTGYSDLSPSLDECEPPLAPPHWTHRDGYAGGGIFFPASITEWYYKPGKLASTFTGGNAETYFWYYVNATYSTAAGPILVDGNDFTGWNFNDVQGSPAWNNPERGASTSGGGNFYDFNRILRNYGLTRPFAINTLQVENDNYSFVHYINDIWSLDDLEVALAKYQIWYTHLRTRMADGQKGDLDTDLVMTYPTKHDHMFFTDWPFMWNYSLFVCPDPDPATVNGTGVYKNRVVTNDVYQYWSNLIEYRGNALNFFPLFVQMALKHNYPPVKSVEELKIFADGQDYEDEFVISKQYNYEGLTLAQWFQKRYYNGRIYLDATIWDREQNQSDPEKELPPPGSPWYPNPAPPKYAPHEVNIARAGELTPAWVNNLPTGTINDLNWLLEGAVGKQFGRGQFKIEPSYLNLGQRVLWDWSEDLDESYVEVDQHTIYNWYKGKFYVIPPIGLVIHNHDFGDQQAGVTRSAMAEWHYLQDWIYLNCKPWGCPEL